MKGKPQIIIGGVWGYFLRFLASHCGLSFLDGYPRFTKEVKFEQGFKMGSTTITESMMKVLQELAVEVDNAPTGVNENARKSSRSSK